MIKHVVMWKIRDEYEGKTKAELALELRAALESLKTVITPIHHLEVGVNFNESRSAFDVVLYSTFKNITDLKAYKQHPDHQDILGYVKKIATERCVVDYEI